MTCHDGAKVGAWWASVSFFAAQWRRPYARLRSGLMRVFAARQEMERRDGATGGGDGMGLVALAHSSRQQLVVRYQGKRSGVGLW